MFSWANVRPDGEGGRRLGEIKQVGLRREAAARLREGGRLFEGYVRCNAAVAGRTEGLKWNVVV